MDVRRGGDVGEPVMAKLPESPSAQSFLEIARVIRERTDGDAPSEESKKSFFSSIFNRG